jgi:hypothetical protein
VSGPPVLVAFGARNVGRAVVTDRLAAGWRALAVARSDDHSFGGGPIVAAPPDRLESWVAGFLPAAWAILREGGAALARRGSGTLIQVSGGSARRGMPGRGPWAAAGRPSEDALAPEDVAAAVAYLAGQSPRGWTHELVVTPAGDTWVP